MARRERPEEPEKPEKPAESIRVIVAADSGHIARRITSALTDWGCAARAISLSGPSTWDRLRELRPSVVVLRSGGRDTPAAQTLARIAEHGGPAFVLLTPAASQNSLSLAAEAGAMLHLVEPVTAAALAAAVRVAAARAQDFRRLTGRVTELQESMKSREIVDRAKQVLMRRFAFTEEEAHRRLQTESRNRNRKLVDTAWRVIQAEEQMSKVGPGLR